MEVRGRKVTAYSVALLGIVLLGVFLRLYYLDAQSIWMDEATSVYFSQMSLSQIVQSTAADVHPSLYYSILHYWVALFGTSAVAVRSLSVLFGVLAIPITYLLGRRLFNGEAGLLAALILAVSTFNVQYSQEARMYSLMVLLALLSMYFFLRLLRKSSLAIAAGYVLATTLLLYTHIYGLFVLLAQDIYLVSLIFLLREQTVRPKQWIALQAIVVGLFAPWIPVLMSQATSMAGGVGYYAVTPTLRTLLSSIVLYSGVVVNSQATLTYASGLLAVVFLVLSVLALFRYTKVTGSMDWKAPLKALQSYVRSLRIANVEPVYFLFVWLVIINIIPFIISFHTPIYLARYTIAASVALYLLVARGINNINHKHTKLAVIGIIVVLSAANLQQSYTEITKPQAREATDFINANFKSGDVVLIAPDWMSVVFDYYKAPGVVAEPIHTWAVTDKPTNFYATPSINRPEDKIKEIQSYINGSDRIWYLDNWPGITADNFRLSVLNESYAQIYVKSYLGYDVYLFEKRAPTTTASFDLLLAKMEPALKAEYRNTSGERLPKNENLTFDSLGATRCSCCSPCLAV